MHSSPGTMCRHANSREEMKNGTEVSPVIMTGEIGNFKSFTVTLIPRQVKKFIKYLIAWERFFFANKAFINVTYLSTYLLIHLFRIFGTGFYYLSLAIMEFTTQTRLNKTVFKGYPTSSNKRNCLWMLNAYYTEQYESVNYTLFFNFSMLLSH